MRDSDDELVEPLPLDDDEVEEEARKDRRLRRAAKNRKDTAWMVRELWPFPVAFLVMNVLAVACIASGNGWAAGLALFIGSLIGIPLAFLTHAFHAECPHCGSHWTKTAPGYWTHQNMDGSPDMRYRRNLRVPERMTCIRCGRESEYVP